jgi:hypothetical protein
MESADYLSLSIDGEDLKGDPLSYTLIPFCATSKMGSSTNLTLYLLFSLKGEPS